MLPTFMNRRDLAILAGGLFLLGLGVIRVLLLSASDTRQISVEAVIIKSIPIKSGASIEQEEFWTPPVGVFVVGWSPEAGAPSALPELHLLAGTTSIFSSRPTSLENLSPTFLPSGTGFLVRKGERLRLQLRVRNSGPDGETHGARVLLYFHPADWR